jgi:hypothetical protein
MHTCPLSSYEVRGACCLFSYYRDAIAVDDCYGQLGGLSYGPLTFHKRGYEGPWLFPSR